MQKCAVFRQFHLIPDLRRIVINRRLVLQKVFDVSHFGCSHQCGVYAGYRVSHVLADHIMLGDLVYNIKREAGVVSLIGMI